jgi:hypothetical protein
MLIMKYWVHKHTEMDITLDDDWCFETPDVRPARLSKCGQGSRNGHTEVYEYIHI